MNVHIVQKGDTMWLIAKKYGISLESLIASNPQIADPNRIDVGMTINLPVGMEMENKAYETKAMQTKPMQMQPMMQPMMQQMQVQPMQMKPMEEAYTPISAPAEKQESGWPEHLKTMTYVVKAGDTLFKVAKMFGIPLAKLISANPQIPEPDKIDVGQKIFVPKENHSYHMPQQMPMYPCMQMPKMQMTAPMPQMQMPAAAQKPTMQMPAVQAPAAQMPMQMPPMSMEMHQMHMPPMHTTYFMTYLVPCCMPCSLPCSKSKHSKCKDGKKQPKDC